MQHTLSPLLSLETTLSPVSLRIVLRLLMQTLVLSAMLLGALQAQAQVADRASVHRIKAAFVYRFTEYVAWPPAAFAQPGSPFVIGVLSHEALAEELVRITEGRRVTGRPVAVRKLGKDDSLSGVQVLFVGGAENPRLPEILAGIYRHPVLTITEAQEINGAQAGMINFVEEGNRVRFDIALPPAEQAGLKISARLLSVARKVASRTW